MGLAIAVLRTTKAVPVENHQVSSENLQDYINWSAFGNVYAVYYKSQDGAVPQYNAAINGSTYGAYNFVMIYPYVNPTLIYSLDFGTSENATSMSLGLAAGYPPGVVTEINVYVDSPSTTPISTLYLTDTGYPFEYTFFNFTAKVTATPEGLHAVYFIFTPSSPSFYCNFGWFQFYQ